MNIKLAPPIKLEKHVYHICCLPNKTVYNYRFLFLAMSSRFIFGCVILLFLSFSVGCASFEPRPSKYEITLNPLVGIGTKNDMIKKYGLPDRKETTEQSEFWSYHFSHGFRKVVTPPQKNPFAEHYSNPHVKALFKPTPGTVKEYEVYEEILLEFDNKGLLKSWKQLH